MDFLNSVIFANREILRFIEKSNDAIFDKVTRGAGGDISRVVDLKAEEIFIKYLARFGTIISEECGVYGSGKDEIIIDPIDGSENMVSKLPYFGTSVARKIDGKIKDGIIVNLANKDIFVKTKDKFEKAKLDRLEFSEVITNNYATIGVYERAYASQKFICNLNKQNIKYRSSGAIALSLAYAHDVRFVLFEGEAREYDVCAGLFMCEDLHIYQDKYFLVVSKEKDIFLKLIKTIKGVR